MAPRTTFPEPLASLAEYVAPNADRGVFTVVALKGESLLASLAPGALLCPQCTRRYYEAGRRLGEYPEPLFATNRRAHLIPDLHIPHPKP